MNTVAQLFDSAISTKFGEKTPKNIPWKERIEREDFKVQPTRTKKDFQSRCGFRPHMETQSICQNIRVKALQQSAQECGKDTRAKL